MVGAVIFAWTDPSAAPPGNNIHTPLNVSDNDQVKSGKLGIATDALDPLYGLTVGNATNLLGIKVSGNSFFEKNITLKDPAVADSTILKADTTVSTNLNADKIDDYDAADFLAAGGGVGKFRVFAKCEKKTQCSPISFWAPTLAPCPAGATEIYYADGQTNFTTYGILYTDPPTIRDRSLWSYKIRPSAAFCDAKANIVDVDGDVLASESTHFMGCAGDNYCAVSCAYKICQY